MGTLAVRTDRVAAFGRTKTARLAMQIEKQYNIYIYNHSHPNHPYPSVPVLVVLRTVKSFISGQDIDVDPESAWSGVLAPRLGCHSV